MSVLRKILAAVAVTMVLAASPASAQFYMKSKDISGAPVRGDEPGVLHVTMAGATEDEINAALLWHLRAALNLGALQCQFEPTLGTVPLYNSTLLDHTAELKKSYDTLTKYFARTAKTKKAGQTALDQFGTQVYSSFTTASPYTFCETIASVGRDAIFQPRGSLVTVARNRMRELHNSLVPWGEQLFPRGAGYDRRILLPRFDDVCWNKKGYDAKKCGPMQWSYR